MCHLDRKRFWNGPEELNPVERTILLRIFSLNELDLLCRLTGFTIQAVFGETDPGTTISSPDTIVRDRNVYRSYVLVLRKEENDRRLPTADGR